MSNESYLTSYIINRYLNKDNNEKTWLDIVNRVSKIYPPIREHILSKQFIPGGRTLATLGTNKPIIPNCVTIDLHDDLANIFETMNRLMELTRRGCGIGMNFGELRPARTFCKKYNAYSSGPVGFLNMFSVVMKTVQQQSRHGAFIGILPITHPDILSFIHVKQNLNLITNFNLSVLITKDFINKLLKTPDEDVISDYELKHYDGTTERITTINFVTYDDKFVALDSTPIKITYHELFEEVVGCAWKTGEPGILFEDNINKENPLKEFLGNIKTCNPCVVAGTLLYTDKGNIIINEHINEIINVWNGERFVPAKVLITGTDQEVYKVVLNDGRTVTTTAYHKFILNDMTKKELKDININEDILWNPYIPNSNNEPIIKYSCGTNYELKIVSITKQEEKEKYVYCVNTLDDSHRATFNNIVTGNCGEIAMYENECCNLGSINLSKFVEEINIDPLKSSRDDLLSDDKNIAEYIYNNYVNISNLSCCVRSAVIYLNGIIDNINTGDEKVDEFVRLTRRLGLGIMGLHDMLILLKLPYDSEVARELVKLVMKLIKETAETTSKELCKKFKSYGDRFYENEKIKNIKILLNKHSSQLCNVALLTVAPNGSTSMIDNVSSGIEPYFSLGYYRMLDNATRESDLIVNKQLLHWVRINIPKDDQDATITKIINKGIKTCNNVPEYIKEVFKTAQDISAEDHIKMMAAVQQFVDNSISKTVNLPEDATKEDVYKSFLLAHKLGIKGLTIYRDNCRKNVILSSLSSDSCKSGNCDL